MDLTDRKKQILKVVVEDYIRTAEPVGSKAIAAEMGGSVSSATIRNELSDLVIWNSPTPRRAGFRPPRATGCMSTS